MGFTIFKRTWWADRACTQPQAGRRTVVRRRVQTVEEARRICAQANDELGRGPGGNGKPGAQGRGPRGFAYEFEED